MSNTLKVTDLEAQVIRAIAECEFGDGPGTDVWSWAVTADFASPKTAAGAIGSLKKKGLVQAGGSGKEATVCLTETGIALWTAMRSATPAA
jgi:hypothetical protein